MKGKLIREYTNSKGTDVFVYALTSENSADLDAYRSTQGDFLREDPEGNPLWFATDFHGETCDVAIAQKSQRVYAVDRSAARYRSLVRQNKDTAVGDALARERASELSASAGVKPKAPTSQSSDESTESSDSDDDTSDSSEF
jgi:hypothetical protein